MNEAIDCSLLKTEISVYHCKCSCTHIFTKYQFSSLNGGFKVLYHYYYFFFPFKLPLTLIYIEFQSTKKSFWYKMFPLPYIVEQFNLFHICCALERSANVNQSCSICVLKRTCCPVAFGIFHQVRHAFH